MSWRSRFRSAFEWIRSLSVNPYFWGGLGVLAAVMVIVIFVVDAIIMPAYTRHDASVRVPKVENQPFEKAKTTLEDKQLDVRREVGRYNPNVGRGVVVDQNPLPNTTVKPGRRVYLTVNAGNVPTVTIPDLNGMSVREARNQVSAIGLTIDTIRADTIPSPYANTITRQSPTPGDSVKEGTSVKLWYSTGLADTTVAVPNVVGRSVANAQDALLKSKLRFVVVDTTTTEEGEGESAEQTDGTGPDAGLSGIFVRRQGRAPGTQVRAGTEIRLFVTDDPVSIPPPDSVANTSGER